MIVDQCDDGNS